MCSRPYRVKWLWIIGDCHGEIFSNHLKHFVFKRDDKTVVRLKRAHLKRCLAYSLNRLGSSMKCREQLLRVLKTLDPKTCEVLLSFGEIDCRCHIVGQAIKQNRSIKQVVNECVDKYFEVVLKDIVSKGLTTYIWNVPPPQQTALSEEFLRSTPYAKRKRAVHLFNRRLSLRCKKSGIPFLTVFSKVTDENGDRLPLLCERHSQHLFPTAMPFVVEEMKRVGIGTLWTNRTIFNLLQKGGKVVEDSTIRREARRFV